MSKVKGGPDMKRFMDKKLSSMQLRPTLLTFPVRLNGNRKVVGVLRGYDQYMNLVLDQTVEEVSATERNEIGMVVIRGNSVVMMEPLERVF
jgi:small nuclear ribonucleoprotein G